MPVQRLNNTGSMERQTRDVSEVGLSEYVDALSKHRKFIGIVVGCIFLLSVLVSLLLPKMYMATARILPPRETSPSFASLISDTDSPISGLAQKLLNQQTPATLYVGIMKSRTVADALNKKFKLNELYNRKYIEDVYTELNERSTIRVSPKDQIISVTVMDRDPQRAADIANSYVDTLDQINRRLNTTEGQRKLALLEERLKEVSSDLEEAENALKDFQERYHLVAIEEQAKVTIEGAAEIKAQIIAAQTELNVLKEFGTERTNEAILLRAKIEALQEQLAFIEEGTKKNAEPMELKNPQQSPNFYIPFGDLPGLGMKLMRLTREAKIQGKVFELLTTQYEIARIDEAKFGNTIQVLDRAVAPEKKCSPKRIRIVMESTFLSLIGAILVVLVRYHYCRIIR